MGEGELVQSISSLKCSHCNVDMLYTMVEFRIGGVSGNTMFIFGPISEVGEKKLPFRVYVCPNCGRAEFYIDEKTKKQINLIDLQELERKRLELLKPKPDDESNVRKLALELFESKRGEYFTSKMIADELRKQVSKLENSRVIQVLIKLAEENKVSKIQRENMIYYRMI